MIEYAHLPQKDCCKIPLYTIINVQLVADGVSRQVKIGPHSFWATVCKTVRPMLSDRCLSVLSVTFVRCGQTVGRIKMKLGMQVDLGLGHIVLDGDPAPPPPKGHSPQFSTHICCCQMAAWIKMSLGTEVRLGPGNCVRWGPSNPQKKGQSHPNSIFGPCLLSPNGWMDEDVTWYGSRPRPRPHIVLDGVPALRERGTATPAPFRPMSVVATVAHLSAAEVL